MASEHVCPTFQLVLMQVSQLAALITSGALSEQERLKGEVEEHSQASTASRVT